jgi:hypothetical protein
MLDIAIWSNDNFMELPPYGRLLQIGLINFADDQGRCKGSPVYLRSQIFPGDTDHINNEEIRRWLNVMVANGTILIYQVEGRDYIQLLNWWKFQSLQYASPSDYPAPDGWQDRIRFNGQYNISLYHNWVKADGTEVEDTCDAQGKPLPFVSQLPRKNQGGRPPKQGNENVPGNVEEKVPGNVPGNVATFPGENVGGNVNKEEYKNNRIEEEEEGGERAATPSPPLPDDDVVDESALKPEQHLYQAVCEILGWDSKTLSRKSQALVSEAVRKLIAAGYSGDEVECFMGEVWALDWRWTKKKQRPTLEEFQAEVGKLHAGTVQTRRNYSGGYARAEAEEAARRKQFGQYNNLLPKLSKGKPS